MKRRVVWKAWKDSDGGIVFTPAERVAKLQADGLLCENAILLHEIVAATGEDAMTQHYRKMDWNPYRPEGEPCPCPNQCGGQYYPLGYGECPNCGPVG